MKNKIIFTAILFFFIINIQSQISCLPQIGNEFIPINVGVNLRENANINSPIIYKVTNPKDVYFYCEEDGYTNDFVKLKIEFDIDYLEENGLKKNFIKLYEHFRDSLKYDIKMKDFVESIKSEEKIKEYYNTIINPNDSLTIQYWSNYDEENIYDVTTIESFKKNYLNLILKPSSEDIIENYNKIGYVNKSQIEYSLNPSFYLYNEFSSEFTLNELNDYLNIKKAKYCEFNERQLFANFSRYILSLYDENKFFLAIKEINKYSTNFTLSKYKYPINFLKMMCSNGDGNHLATITIAKNLIDSYKKNLLPNEILVGCYNSVINGGVSISCVYSFLINSLINTKSNSIAYQYSTECLKNKKLQYDNYLLNHGAILFNLNKKAEACKIFNQEYLKGNEEAKKILEENCN
jgi:hypothetical protein